MTNEKDEKSNLFGIAYNKIKNDMQIINYLGMSG